MNEMILRMNPATGGIAVEVSNNGIITHKEISNEQLTDCLNLSIHHPGYSSGLLPENCISFYASSDGERAVCILHPERYADISYYKTVYRNFPLPRLVFRFELRQGLRVHEVKAGVVDEGRIRPDMKLYHWPFSNVNGFHMCIGNNVMPKCESLHTLSSLPYLILEIPNNDDHYQESHNKKRFGYRELLEHLKDKDPSYYYKQVLIPSGRILSDFIKQ